MQNYLQPTQFRNFNNGFKVVSIASDTEINNIAEDYSGTPLYFHNRTTNEIIIRQFDISTGLTTTKKYIKYEPTDGEISKENTPESINLYKEDFNALNERIDALKELLEKKMAKGVKNE